MSAMSQGSGGCSCTSSVHECVRCWRRKGGTLLRTIMKDEANEDIVVEVLNSV